MNQSLLEEAPEVTQGDLDDGLLHYTCTNCWDVDSMPDGAMVEVICGLWFPLESYTPGSTLPHCPICSNIPICPRCLRRLGEPSNG